MMRILQLIILSVHCTIIENMITYTKNCSKPEDSEVVWNITINNITISDADKDNIIMQTKDYNADDTYENWKDLKNCTRNLILQQYIIRCEIDSHDIRMRYNLRVIRQNKASTTRNITGNIPVVSSLFDSPYSVLVPPTLKGNYQDGLLCYPAHGLINFRSFNVTSTSLVIAWSFYTWDLDFIYYLTITVKHHQETIMTFNIDCRLIYIDQYQERVIRGLQKCRTYAIEVRSQYTLDDSQSEYLTISTKCPRKSVTSVQFSSLELTIIISSSLLLLMVMGFCFYFIFRSREDCYKEDKESDTMHNFNVKKREADIIDDKDISNLL